MRTPTLRFLITPLLTVSSCAFAGNTIVRGGGLSVEISERGEIVAGRIGRSAVPLRASSSLDNCTVQSVAPAKPLAPEGVEVSKALACGNHSVTLVERFMPTAASVHWELEITSADTNWSTPIRTSFEYGAASRFWTTWAHPELGCPADKTGNGWECENFPWGDPLALMPLRDAALSYGAPAYSYEGPRIGYSPFNGDLFSIPIATLIDPVRDRGISLVQSPDDKLLDLTLATTAQGKATFTRLFHRLGAAPLLFRLDLVAHEGDWRGGLRWMTAVYPQYFNPSVAGSEPLAGTSAYSNFEGELDVAKLKRMAFRTNWKASFDFPYMGMFLPPVADDANWERFGKGPTSIAHMRDYAARMREKGFYVLDYFNVTEFGTGIVYPAPPRKAVSDADLWRDPNDFLYAKLPNAILYVPDRMKVAEKSRSQPGRPYYTWEGAIATDAGDPAYRDFLLEQAQRHVDKLPESSGIAIDRMDWLRAYNDRADDGVSWFEGRPTRSLLNSWRDLMERLGPLMHKSGRFIFLNNHTKRIDLVRHADGFFDEFTNGGAPLNLTAFLGIRKTTLGWTVKEDNLKPDPHAFFQKYLYLGVYPMAPFPGNDHSIEPSEWAEQQYMLYGPLLDAMRGKKWVLAPHAVTVPSGSAKANLFEVPDGYVVPVVYGGAAAQTEIVLRGIDTRGYTAEALNPGETAWVEVGLKGNASGARFTAPLKHGCAMVRLTRAGA